MKQEGIGGAKEKHRDGMSDDSSKSGGEEDE